MPWLLYRYILGELLRVMVLTTAILVTVIAFGAAIKPLTNEDLLSAGQTAKYIVLAIVPMLQFALPFAAGFAATIVLHRLTSDNEITAAAVSGISYPRLLLPIGLLGAMLALVMVFLTQSLIPAAARQPRRATLHSSWSRCGRPRPGQPHRHRRGGAAGRRRCLLRRRRAQVHARDV
jgi:lipopolysaccharide export LptBFGC system permease protein LptF